MTEKLAYSYTVLRYVHDVVTDEFVNVGVVVHVPSRGQLHIKTRSSIGRIKCAFPDLDRSAFVSAMSAVTRGVTKISREIRESGFLAKEGNAASFARLALPADESSIQLSDIGTGATADVEKTLERLYGRFVTRYDTRPTHRRSDEDVWRPVKEKLAERKVHVRFEKKTVVGAADEISFKHAWKNGRWHAYEPVSLDLADSDGIKDKARRWRGHLDAVADGADEELKLHIILGAPQTPALIPAYRKAVEILRAAPFQPAIYEESQVEDLVSEIEDEVRAHDAAVTR